MAWKLKNRLSGWGGWTRQLHLPIADSLVHQFCCNGTIHPAANGADNAAFGATNISDPSDLFVDEVLLHDRFIRDATRHYRKEIYHRPIALTSANVEYETSDDFSTFGRMSYFRVKLDAVEWFAIMGYSRIWRRISLANNAEIRRGTRQLISVGHPYLPERKKTSRPRSDTGCNQQTCISSPKDSNRASAAGFSLPILVSWSIAWPYSR